MIEMSNAYGDIVAELGACVREPWASDKESLMGSQESLFIALSDQQTDNRTF